MNPFQFFIVDPLAWLIQVLFAATGNFGWAIILMTLIVRAVLLPLTLPAIRSQKKLRKLQPQLKALSKQYGADKEGLAKAQLALYKEHNFNPLSGCLPSLIQFIPLIAFYNVLNAFIREGSAASNQVIFLGIDLTLRDPLFLLPVLAAVTQLILSVMILPGVEKHDVIPNTSSSPEVQKANEKETDQQEMAEMVQKQLLFTAPLMTLFFSVTLPAGLSLYWIVSTLLSIVQQYFVSGIGGFEPLLAKVFPSSVQSSQSTSVTPSLPEVTREQPVKRRVSDKKKKTTKKNRKRKEK